VRIDRWVDLSGHGMQLRVLRDRGAAYWCVVPAEGYTASALGTYADGLSSMGFMRNAAGAFHHPASFDRAGRPLNQPLAENFRAALPLAREIAFDRNLHVSLGRPDPRRDMADPALSEAAAAIGGHGEGAAPERTLKRLMGAAVAFAQAHGLDPSEAFEAELDEAPAPRGP
jgi:hypothetical protein